MLSRRIRLLRKSRHMNLILWLVAFIGHLGSWCVVYNRTHATSWRRITRKRCEKLVIVAVLLPMFWFSTKLIRQGSISFHDVATGKLEALYLFLSIGMGIFFISRWIWRKLQSPPAEIMSSDQSLTDAQRELGRNIYLTPLAKLLKKIPFNQSHWIAVESIDLGLSNLPSALDGLKICHLSDFHLTGQLDLAWFEKVVEAANRFEPDLIVVTGDLIDDIECIDWIEPIFGQLKSTHGTYFIRGNHDLRINDQQMLLQRLEASGMNWIGGKFIPIEINGVEISFAGNELPWHAGAEMLDANSQPNASLKILLSHSPDQIEWAKPFNFDLIFAGHCHGGQIVLPVVGPIVAPSKYGVLYASGTFRIDSAIMHVSRGLSGDECIRINCPPEIGCFTLHCTNR